MRDRMTSVLLACVGLLAAGLVWAAASWIVPDLPSPGKTWAESRLYVMEPFEKRGEMDQGILRFTWSSLILVAKGYSLALLIGTPLGFILGVSRFFTRTFDPLIQVLKPISPLAWLPLGLRTVNQSRRLSAWRRKSCAHLWWTRRGFPGNGATVYTLPILSHCHQETRIRPILLRRRPLPAPCRSNLA